MQSNERQRLQEPDIIDIRRRPYPADLQRGRNLRQIPETDRVRRASGAQERGSLQRISEVPGRRDSRRTSGLRPDPAGNAARRPEALRRRRKYIRRQRIAAFVFLGCIAAAFFLLILKPGKTSAADQRENRITREPDISPSQSPDTMIQGLAATVFSAHPTWTEDFLTPNEYSRPGEALPEVKNIFVHYTANPGTSAAQNRNYFEQQKDTHKTSVSAHFIIGYDGEILQCVPLDEIAYAVSGRNYDSVSIECCHKAADGSFTQETYDSLISLLAWLTDAYGLDTEDILRHYDSNGKKCPLYYTEHPEAWERLKEDVAQAGKA